MTIRSVAANMTAAIVFLGAGLVAAPAAITVGSAVAPATASASPYSEFGADTPEQACRQERPVWDGWDYENVWFDFDDRGAPMCYGLKKFYDGYRWQEYVECFGYPEWRFPLWRHDGCRHDRC